MKDLRFNVEKGELYSTTGKGRIPWVSARDIAAVAYHGLTDKVAHNKDYILTGPDLLSYDDVSMLNSKKGNLLTLWL